MSEEDGITGTFLHDVTPPRTSDSSIHIKTLQRDKLSRRVTALRENLDQFSNLSTYQLETKLALLEHHFKLFDKLQSDLESLDESQIDQDHRSTFEDSFCEIKSAIVQRMTEMRGGDTLNSTTLPMMQSSPATRHSLPKLQLTKFSGNHTEWLDFYNMFCALVHNNSALDDIEKFQYLRSCLLNSAFRLIQSLEVTSQNYSRAVDLLVKRYDNKRYIFQSHLQAIFDNKGFKSSSASSLREFIDGINSHLRALQSLATRTQIADGILLHFIVSKLDPEMQVKWEEYIASKWDTSSSSSLQLPTWDDLAIFIERRCQTVNIIENSRRASAKGTQAVKSSLPVKAGTSFVSSSTNKCVLCNEATSHSAFKCDKFNAMDPLQRYDLVKKNRLCINCLGVGHTSSKCPSTNRCQHCKVSHHSLLHRHAQPGVPQNVDRDHTSPSSSSSTALNVSKGSSDVILATALVQLSTNNGVKITARALLDSASQLNFITERTAQLLKLRRSKMNIEISGIGVLKTKSYHGGIVTLQSLHTGFVSVLETVILPSISSHQPHNTIDITDWRMPININLADCTFNRPAPIDLLIGAGIFFDILSVGQIKLSKNLPTLQKTQLGWIVAGYTNSSPVVSTSSLITSTLPIATASAVPATSQPSLDAMLEKFWNIEDTYHSRKIERMLEENECETHFRQTTSRCPITNKFIVRLPFSSSPSTLGDSLEIARRRFFSLEKKLATHSALQAEYENFIRDYIDMKHMVLVQPNELSAKAHTYIPHHCVMKLDSSTTRLRVVFDASCRTTNGVSLNSILRTGPTVQDDIFAILLRFRTHRFVLMADITKMYRQIIVDERDAKYQCIWWRNSPDEHLRTYQLQTVTYGTSCAPFLAIRCLQQLAYENRLTHPVGAAVTLRDFYVDNLMTGASTIEEVVTIKNEVIDLLTRGGFPLRKCASNNDDIIADIPTADKESSVNIGDVSYIKALGLKWSPHDDFFVFSYTPMEQSTSKTSKRTILSKIASFFDPLGLLNPIIVTCKLLMQDLWKLKLSWDESVPMSIYTQWTNICSQLRDINQLRVPRFVSFDINTNLHAFADASTRAYGACIYAVSQSEGTTHATLICAKSRVAPTKEMTLPKLELCAAVLASELLQTVTDAFSVNLLNIHCWSDSTIVLSWLQGDPARWTTFVSNRVRKIHQLTSKHIWHHVPSAENPADLVSRGARVQDLIANNLWFHGPSFLPLAECSWPHNPINNREDLPEQRKSHQTFIAVESYDIIAQHKYINNYHKILRIFAYVYRFILKVRRSPTVRSGPIIAEELDNALMLVCRYIQGQSFAVEYNNLQNGTVNMQSHLNQLSPFLHNNLIRVGGRISNSTLPFDTKHPILLPRTHPFTYTLIDHLHRHHLHAGCQTLLSILRDKFWVINARRIIRQIVHKCIMCYRNKPRLQEQIMASLPEERVKASFPFATTGIDYCGPFSITQQIRGRVPIKIYLAVFICFTTKAVHLELVPDLSTKAFIAALKRFIARRGKCATIYSDNATNFVGANRELKELLVSFTSQQHVASLETFMAEEGIRWKFIPPRSPHFGGLWESAVKRAKYYLRRTIGSHILNFDELSTVCCQVEAMINSRPLTPMSSNPDDLRAITPAHFLIGRSLHTVPEPSVTHTTISKLQRFQIIQSIQQQFWERWHSEYVRELQHRVKWRSVQENLKENDLVLIKGENTPPLKWTLGRIIETRAGRDGLVRSVTVKTANGVDERAITKICKLPIESST